MIIDMVASRNKKNKVLMYRVMTYIIDILFFNANELYN